MLKAIDDERLRAIAKNNAVGKEAQEEALDLPRELIAIETHPRNRSRW